MKNGAALKVRESGGIGRRAGFRIVLTPPPESPFINISL
jgi:hypothetical protein